MKRSRMQGITMTELMTVIFVFGILLSIATLSMAEHINRAKLKAAAMTVTSHVRLARCMASSTSSPCFISFDPVSNSYTINGTQFIKIPEGVRFGIDPSVTGRPSDPSLPPPADGVSFGSGNQASFYPTGMTSPTGTIYLTNGKHTMAITIAITGRPRVWRSTGGRRWTAS